MPVSGVLRVWGPIISRLKTQLTLRSGCLPQKLEEALHEALDMYDSMLASLAGLERENRTLRSQMSQLERDWDYLFQKTAIACVMTDATGKILRGNDRAAVLLNTSLRHLEREHVPLMYFAQDRQTYFGLLKAVASTREDARATLLIRPRERAPVSVDVVAVPRTAADDTAWLWFLAPRSPMQHGDASNAKPTAVRVASS